MISTTETSKQEIIAEIDTENHKNNDAIAFLKEDCTGVTEQHWTNLTSPFVSRNNKETVLNQNITKKLTKYQTEKDS